MIITGHGPITGPDIVKEHVRSVLDLIEDHGCQTKEDAIAMIQDLRRAIGILSDLRDLLPTESSLHARDLSRLR